MNEMIGLAYYAEIPSVFIDVQRTGPSTGMPTRTQQGDLLEVAYASHGDTKHVALFPADPAECFDFAVRAFDLAERFQTPVFLVSDLDIGMNDWVCRRLEWDDEYVPDRGKVLDAEELEAMAERGEAYHRYLDTDGDEIPYRTLPGDHPHGAYFTRGSGHTKWGTYTEDADEYTEVVDRLARKVDAAAEAVPAPVVERREGAELGIVTLGGCDAAVREAADRLAERGVALDFLRVRGFPFAAAVEEFLEAHPLNFVVEQNRDAQLLTLLVNETRVKKERLASVRRYGGLPLSAVHVVEDVLDVLEERGIGRAKARAEIVRPASGDGRREWDGAGEEAPRRAAGGRGA